MGFIGRFFRNPKAYESDPKGFVINQIGHMVIGLSAYGISLLAGFWIVPLVLIGFAIWEYLQVVRFNGIVWDSIEDFSFVLFGCLVISNYILLVSVCLWLVVGYLQRKIQVEFEN